MEKISGPQVRLNRQSPTCWRVIFDNPPLNLMGPQLVLEFREIMTAIESDQQVKVVVFERAVDGKRQRDRTGLRHVLREPGKGGSVAVGSRGRPYRRWRPHGATATAHRKKPRVGSAPWLGGYRGRPGGVLWLCESVVAGRRPRRFRRGACESD